MKLSNHRQEMFWVSTVNSVNISFGVTGPLSGIFWE